MKKIDLSNKDLAEEDFRAPQAAIVLAPFYIIYYSDSIGNCKHCHLDYITNLINIIKQKGDSVIKKLTPLFTVNEKITFACNVNNVEDLKVLIEHYELISCVKIPLGYHGDYQYHVIFFTNVDKDIRDKYEYIKRMKYEKVKLLSEEDIKALR